MSDDIRAAAVTPGAEGEPAVMSISAGDWATWPESQEWKDEMVRTGKVVVR